MRKQPKIIFKPGMIDKMVKEHDTTLTSLAAEIGIGYTQLYRTSLPIDDKNFNFVGSRVIAGILNAFPETKFDDYFDIILI
jgi:hypothetical protein